MAHDPQIQDERRALQARLPHLAQRVFALGGKSYWGGGFHWSLVKSIGGLLHNVNDFDSPYDGEKLSVHEVVYEGVLESVRLAEIELELKQIRAEGQASPDYPDPSDLALLALVREYGYDPLLPPSTYTEIRQVLRELAKKVLAR